MCPGTDANANAHAIAAKEANDDAPPGPGPGPGTNSGWEQGTAGQQQPQLPQEGSSTSTSTSTTAAAVGRRQTTNCKAPGGPQKKLTPPPQLHERKLLRVSSVSVRRPDHSSSSTDQQHQQLDQSLPQRSRSLSVYHQSRSPPSQDYTASRHIRVYLQAGTGGLASLEQKNDGEQGQTQTQPPSRPTPPTPPPPPPPPGPPPPSREPPPRPAPPPRLYPVPGRRNGVGIAVPLLGSAPRNRATIANFNRKHRQTQTHLSTVSTSAAHHRTYWPDSFRDPRHGLAIRYNTASPNSTLPIPPTPPIPPIPKSVAGDLPKPRLAEIGPLEE
ncbi:hypothetical protein LZ30DRAFT_604181 [Colletotrichum cereale]|nr:hypothetical protein LZ30DRAFT_604181 [Colletotrichum cereale]